jgi:hypothetical protein
VLVVRKHHFLVRWSHWLNVPVFLGFILGLILSGISIYWASPIYQHKPDPNRGNTDVAADGLRFDGLLRSYPSMSQAKWARVDFSVHLDGSGDPDPYFVSLDLATIRHPQTLLAPHFDGQPLTVDDRAPLPLLVPMKLGLKKCEGCYQDYFVADEPRDEWSECGYSRYDGI